MLLRFLAVFATAFFLFGCLPSSAQTIVTCSSENGRRNFCAADTRGGVTLGRQRSGSPCQRGYSWGFDARGIWVDRGCRADFVLGRVRPGRPVPPPRPMPGPGGPVGQLINCSSEDGRRKYCPADTRRGVVLERQRSGSPCRQGYSWGYDRRGIWVDRGCRADFRVR